MRFVFVITIIKCNILYTCILVLLQPPVVEFGRSASQPDMKAESDVDSKRSLSSEFEVITDSEVKKVNTAEDIVNKYRKRTKNTLREGNSWMLYTCSVVCFIQFY